MFVLRIGLVRLDSCNYPIYSFHPKVLKLVGPLVVIVSLANERKCSFLKTALLTFETGLFYLWLITCISLYEIICKMLSWTEISKLVPFSQIICLISYSYKIIQSCHTVLSQIFIQHFRRGKELKKLK